MSVGRGTVLLAAVLMLVACGADEPDADGAVPPFAVNVELPAGVTTQMVAQGQRLFNQQTCFTCHGRNAAGGPLGPALDDEQWLTTDGSFESLVEVIRTGVPRPRQFGSPMPAMGGSRLTDEQIRQLAAYIFAVSRGS